MAMERGARADFACMIKGVPVFGCDPAGATKMEGMFHFPSVLGARNVVHENQVVNLVASRASPTRVFFVVVLRARVLGVGGNYRLNKLDGVLNVREEPRSGRVAK